MNRFLSFIFCIIVMLTVCIQETHAGISVKSRAFGSTDPSAWTNPTGVSITSAGWTTSTQGVTIAVSGDQDYWIRCTAPTSESIGEIAFTGSGNIRVFVVAPDGSGNGPSDFTEVAPLGSAACLHFGNVVPGSTTVTMQAAIG